MQLDDLAVLAHWHADQTHPPQWLAACRLDLRIENKPVAMRDRIVAEALHGCAGILAIKSYGFRACDPRMPWEAENLVHARGPGQLVVRKNALPPSGAIASERMPHCEFGEIPSRDVEGLPELELARAFEEGPASMEGAGLNECQFSTAPQCHSKPRSLRLLQKSRDG